MTMGSLAVFRNQRGNALVIALLMLACLTLLGIASLMTSTVELQVSGSDRIAKTAFYAADGGTEMASELLEQNIEERSWSDPTDRGDVRVTNGDFCLNRESDTADPMPSDTNRDAYYPKDAVGYAPHTNIKVRGRSALSTGSAIQLAAGYEGRGRGAGAGGAWIIYDVRAQYLDNRGNRNTQAKVNLGWRHVM
jgi:Tfp pilus assembly protein PilX